MRFRILSCLLALGVLATTAAAQQLTGTMSGVVKDAQGAVLRGVTVRISSDALVGGARTAVTSEAGTYQVAALPPGTFTVSFELTGFKTLKREGVTIQTALKTGVDAAMGIGTVEGSVTVSGEARIVDTSAQTEVSIDNALDGVVLSLDPRVGDAEAGQVKIDGKTITEVEGQRPR